jgi:hypothetical protein
MARALERRMKALDKAMEAWARARGVCSTHGVRLWCPHEYQWTGTEAEWQEVLPLMDRMMPYLARCQPSGQYCPLDGHALWCSPCHTDQLRGVALPDDLMTPAETTRYLELVALMRPTPQTTPAVPEPIAVPEPTPEPVVSRPAPEPPPVADDEDETVDAELQAIVAQLQARIPDDQTGIAQHLKNLIDQLD